MKIVETCGVFEVRTATQVCSDGRVYNTVVISYVVSELVSEHKSTIQPSLHSPLDTN